MKLATLPSRSPFWPFWPLWRERLGLPGTLALLALLAAGLLAGVLTPRWQAQADSGVAAAQRSLRAQAALKARDAAQRPAAAERPVWPSAASTPDRAAALLSLAQRSGVSVQRSREQAGDGGHLQVSSSARGSYAALRSYIGEALAEDPALVLERIRLFRSTPDAREIEAELQWTLLQSPAAAGGAAR